MTSYEAPDLMILGTVEDLTAGKNGGSDGIDGSFFGIPDSTSP
jgi:hypothetical protein